MSWFSKRIPAGKRIYKGRRPEHRPNYYRPHRLASLLACGAALLVVSTTVSTIVPETAAIARPFTTATKAHKAHLVPSTNGTNKRVAKTKKASSAYGPASRNDSEASAASQYSEAVEADAPISYWPLADAGSTAADVVGDNNGEIVGGVTLNQPGPMTGAASMYFNGGDYINLSQDCAEVGCSLEPSNTLTVEAWVKTTTPPSGSYTTAALFGAKSNVGYLLAIGQLTGNPADVVWGTGGAVANPSDPSGILDGAWHYLVMTVDGSNANIYVDGVLTDSVPFTQPIQYNATTVAMATDPNDFDTSTFTGNMSEVALYNYALSPQQILAHYQAANVSTTLSITTTSLPTCVLGQMYSASLTASGGTAPYTWALSGELPVGLSLDETTGVISGTPKNPFGSDFTVGFTVEVTDSTKPTSGTATAALSINCVGNLVVGFGDSVAAGYGLSEAAEWNPKHLSGQNGSGRFTPYGPGCSNTPNAYPCLLAQTLSGSETGSQNYSIQGANSKDVLNTELRMAKAQPMADREAVDTVTLTVGADDLVFSDCLAEELEAETDKCLAGTLGNLQLSSTAMGRLSGLSQRLPKILETIHSDYPNAHIFVTGYYLPLPGPVANGEQACNLYALPAVYTLKDELKGLNLIEKIAEVEVFALELNDRMSVFQDRFYQVGSFLVSQLNSYIRSGIASTPATVPITMVGLNFSGHDLCEGTNSWVFAPQAFESVIGSNSQTSFNAPFDCIPAPPVNKTEVDEGFSVPLVSASFISNCVPHPTPTGQQEIAQTIADLEP
jgi:hypothetical protein